jgi:hypothetical protein
MYQTQTKIPHITQNNDTYHTHTPSQTDNNTSLSFFFSIAIYFGWICAEHFTPDEIERTQLQNLQINFKEREEKTVVQQPQWKTPDLMY